MGHHFCGISRINSPHCLNHIPKNLPHFLLLRARLMRKPRGFGSLLTLVSGHSSRRSFVPQRALLKCLIKQAIQERNPTRSLLHTDLGAAGKGCAAGTARHRERGGCPPRCCGDAVLGRAPAPATRELPSRFSPFCVFAQLVLLFRDHFWLFLPLRARGCFCRRESGSDAPSAPASAEVVPSSKGRKAAGKPQRCGARGSRRGAELLRPRRLAFGRAVCCCSARLARVKRRAELAGSSCPGSCLHTPLITLLMSLCSQMRCFWLRRRVADYISH